MLTAYVGTMGADEDIHRAVGRYRASWLYLVPSLLIVALGLIRHVLPIARGRATIGDYIGIGFFLLVLVLVWTIPATVLTTAGYRRGFRFTPWQDVVAVFPAGPGDPDLLIGLRSGKKVSLVGVRHDRRAGVQALVARALDPDLAA